MNEKLKKIKKSYQLYILVLPTILYFLIFHYAPLYGLQIAFKNFRALEGIWGSQWSGFDHFVTFFRSHQFLKIVQNTFGLSLYALAMFPVPVIMALLLNQVIWNKFKRFVQTVTYAPHFISIVVLVGMINVFMSYRAGVINNIMEFVGLSRINFLAETSMFKSIFVLSGVWQSTGFNMIVYLAALSSVNPELHSAALIDGASKFKRVLYIDIPGISPTIIILLILSMGNIMSVGFEKVFLMQNPINIESSEVIQTYVYKTGIVNMKFSYSAAIGLFNSFVNFVFLFGFNQLMKKFGETSLW